jgi:hypothetical protein
VFRDVTARQKVTPVSWSMAEDLNLTPEQTAEFREAFKPSCAEFKALSRVCASLRTGFVCAAQKVQAAGETSDAYLSHLTEKLSKDGCMVYTAE